MYERSLLATLLARVNEPRQFIQVVVGPRQVGKTTLIGQLVGQLPAGQFIVRTPSGDDIDAWSPAWLDQIWQSLRVQVALSGNLRGLLCIDEVQKVTGWAEAIKRNWDADARSGAPIGVILTGSSRLLLQDGLSESLMGRYELHYLGHWSFPEMRDAFGFTPDQFAWFGGYPGAASLIDDEPRFKSYVAQSIIEASLSRDIFMLARIDKPALMRVLFDLGLSYSGQIVSLNKMLGQLVDAGNTTTLTRYLRLLDEAGLLAGLNKFSTHQLAARASSPKFQPHNMALNSCGRTQLFQEAISDAELWGRVVESAVGAQLLNQVRANPSARLSYWRDGNNEVDFVLEWNGKTVGIEVKSKTGPAQGLDAFARQFPEVRTLLVSDASLDWRTFLATPLDAVVGVAATTPRFARPSRGGELGVK